MTSRLEMGTNVLRKRFPKPLSSRKTMPTADLMKLSATAFLVTLLAFFLTPRAASRSSSPTDSAAESASTAPFLGRWDLTLQTPDREYPSWLELREESGQLKAQFVGRWGNARPLPKVELSNGTLTFVSPKEEEDTREDLVFQGRLVGKTLAGTTTGQNGAPWRWTGQRTPALARKATPAWGKPMQLFNGRDLTGWRENKPGPSPAWKVEDGTLVSPGHGPELIHEGKFENFKLHVEFNCASNANSGVYLRGRYEVALLASLRQP